MTKNEFFIQAYLAALSANPLVNYPGTYGGDVESAESHARKCSAIATAATKEAAARGVLAKE
jgi:hypothetical protein